MQDALQAFERLIKQLMPASPNQFKQAELEKDITLVRKVLSLPFEVSIGANENAKPMTVNNL